MELAQAGLVVGQIAKAEGSDDQIERVGTERQMQRVGLKGTAPDAAARNFRAPRLSMRVRKIGGENRAARSVGDA